MRTTRWPRSWNSRSFCSTTVWPRWMSGAVGSRLFGMMMAVASDLPDLENRREYQDARNSVLVDSQGQTLGVLTNNQSRVLVRYQDLSPYMINAIIAIEDRRFYENSGVDVRGIGRALVQDVLSRK